MAGNYAIGYYHCIFECGFATRLIRSRENCFVILLPFVDDILLTGTDQGIETFVEERSREFKTRDLGTPKLLLGIQIECCKDKLIIHQY